MTTDQGEHRAVDHRGADISVGSVVSYYDAEKKSLFTGEVRMVAKEQVVIDSGGHLELVTGALRYPAGVKGPDPARYSSVVVLPAEYR